MKTIIIYDSFFGNTENAAKIISEVLRSKSDVKVVRASDFNKSDLQHTSLVILGSPTRAFRPTPAIMKTVKIISHISHENIRVAVFDTRMDISEINFKFLSFMMRIFGYAADKMIKQFKREETSLAAEPGKFMVSGSEGPLKDGEEARIREWAAKIADSIIE